MGMNLNMGSLVNQAMSAMGGGVLGGLFSGASKFKVGGLGSVLSSIMNGGKSAELTGYVYKYNVKSYQVMLPGEDPIDLLPEAISSIIITRDYQNCIHPILEINTSFPPKVHQKLVKNKKEAKIRLRVQKTKYTRHGDRVVAEDYINDTYDVIIDDETDFKDEDTYNNENKANGGNGTENGDKGIFNITDYTTTFTLSLWNQKHIDIMRKVINDIIPNATMSTVIAKLYGDAGVEKMLISPLDNNKSYSEVRIAPMNLMNLPNYIDKIYGVYYTGSSVFYDFRCLYYLSKNGVCDAKEQGEYTRTIFVIPKSDSVDKDKTGTTVDNDNKLYYMYIPGDQIDFDSPGSTNDAISGNNMTIVDTNRNETTTIKGAGEQRGEGNAKVKADNYSNEYSKSTILSDVVEQSLQATVQCMDYDEDCFTPNKEFVINFEDTKLQNRNGFYRITGSTVILNKVAAELRISATHKFAFKAPLGGESGKKTDVNVASNNTTTTSTQPTQPSGLTDRSGRVKAVSSQPGVSPTVQGPQGKELPSNEVVVSNTDENSNIPRNTNYEYDTLGNIQGVNIPEYNQITENDSLEVANAKKRAQQNSLPSEGPRGKFTDAA